MTDSGASQQIADTIVDKLGIKLLPVALLIIGVIFGMSMFYEVAFLIVTPLVISIAKEADIPYMRLIIPLFLVHDGPFSFSAAAWSYGAGECLWCRGSAGLHLWSDRHDSDTYLLWSFAVPFHPRSR